MRTENLEGRELKLTNNGELELFFVGIGSAFSKRLYQTNLLIIKGNDHLLVDCGTKCPQGLHELGLPVTNIRNFLITHSHADHVGGLEEVILMNRYVVQQKPTIIINKEYERILWNMSLRGGCAHNEGEPGSKLRFEDFWNVLRPRRIKKFPRETFRSKLGKLDIKMVRTKHIPDSAPDWESSFWSCGVIIDDRILFTSDTRFDEDLLLEYNSKFNLDIIFHDTQFFTGGVHTSIEELSGLPEKIKKKILLTHYGDNWEDFEDKVLDMGFQGLCRQHLFYIFE